MVRIGIDIGGTFTDFVIYEPFTGKITRFKLLSDASNPARTVLQGLCNVLGDQPAQIIHGSTVATNALLERKGARTALITTRGFKDVLQIGRQNRPNLYDWSIEPQPPLVASEMRLEVDERVDAHGKVITSLDVGQIESITELLANKKVESVAVCLLFSFLYPQHEQLITERLRQAGYTVSASCEILPEYREYERTSTTVINAYVSLILDKYLSTLQNSLPSSSLQIMQSSGGMMNLTEARVNGARCILSGPAGGIIGAQHLSNIALSSGHTNLKDQKVKIITFDMGGTSTDVSLIDGQPILTTEAIVGGCPIHLPLLDIHTIGAGGGSIAFVDAGGSLRVGPQSAGANPGPACYGIGDQPTVTDANLVLGRLLPEHFLGGEMKIFPERAYAALSKLGEALKLSPVEAAFGVLEVVNIQMERALRVISVERGHDPREFSLFSFGGAGGLHAVDLARDLGIPKVIISQFASTLSALGMLASNIVKDYVQTVMLPGETTQDQLNAIFAPIVERGINEVMKQGISHDQIDIELRLDVRYSGQSYELSVPFTQHIIEDFHKIHTTAYGYAYSNKAIEIVNVRVRAIGKIEPIKLQPIDAETNELILEPVKYTNVYLEEGSRSIPLLDYDLLTTGTKIEGPALIVAVDTTILIKNKDSIIVDPYKNLLIDIGSVS